MDFNSAINNKKFDDNLYAIVYSSTWEKLNKNIKKLKNKMENNKIPVKAFVENNKLILKSKIIEKLYNILLNLFEIKYYPTEEEAIIQLNNIEKLEQKKIFKYFNIKANKNNMQKYEKITNNAMNFLKYLEHVNNINKPEMFKKDFVKNYNIVKELISDFYRFLYDFLNIY